MSIIDIGIISVTIIGATLCQRELDRLINEKNLDIGYICVSCNLAEIKQAVNDKNWRAVAEIIIQAGQKLIAAGAKFIIIPSNTPHYAYAEIQEHFSTVQVMNLIELTAQECVKKGYKKVAALGTKQTMQDGLFSTYLQQHQITPVVLNEEIIEDIDLLIKENLIYGRENLPLQRKIEENLREIDCDAFILGCTELPEVYPTTLVEKPAIDTTKLLAREAVQHAQKLLLNSPIKMFGR